MYWSVDKRYTAVFEDAGIPFVKRFSIPWLFKMTRARFWVINSRLPLMDSKAKAYDVFANLAWNSVEEISGRYERGTYAGYRYGKI